MKRIIGLWGAVFTIVGYVVGASIWILPGELATSAGPGVVVAYLLAAVPALFVCFVCAQVGSAYPVSGANYVAVSRLLSPLWGFMVVWSIILAVVVAVALVAFGIADFLSVFWADVPRGAVAIGTVVLFTGVNMFGARLSVGSQAVLVALFTVGMLVFGLGGVANADWGLLTPTFPNGFSPVLAATVAAYFSFMGFTIVTDLAGEITDPARTIPKALTISFLVIVFLYAIVSVSVPALVPWQSLAAESAPVASAAATFLPPVAASLISVGAILAAATSVNAIILAQSRDLYALAADQIFPAWFAHLTVPGSVPDRAVLTIGGLSVGAILMGATITQYAMLSVMGFMIIQILMGLAMIVLPARDPERFRRSGFRLAGWQRWLFGGGTIATSILFLAVGLMEETRNVVLFLTVVAAGVLVYGWRQAVLVRRGTSISDVLRKNLPVGEDVGAGA